MCTAFQGASKDLSDALATVTWRISATYIDPSGPTAFIACRLIPLDNKPGVRPIGISETTMCIVSKAILRVTKADIQSATVSLQLCTVHDAGCEDNSAPGRTNWLKTAQHLDITEQLQNLAFGKGRRRCWKSLCWHQCPHHMHRQASPRHSHWYTKFHWRVCPRKGRSLERRAQTPLSLCKNRTPCCILSISPRPSTISIKNSKGFKNVQSMETRGDVSVLWPITFLWGSPFLNFLQSGPKCSPGHLRLQE